MKFSCVTRGVEIHHDGDLPARSGMGSSSAFTVGLLHAMYALRGQLVGKHQLAMEAIHVEQDLLKETVGSQDQVMAAYGGLNYVSFLPSGDIATRPIILSRERREQFNAHLMLVYTGIKRTACEVANSYVADIDSRRQQLRVLHTLVEEGMSTLSGNSDDIADFGRLLHEAWQVKRKLSEKVSNDRVDEIYRDALSAGAIGGKLLGAGGGGFMMLFVPPERQQAVKSKLTGLLHVPFKFEFSGSQIIFYDPETDYSDADSARDVDTVRPFRELFDQPGPSST